jgi:hypothetical protein
VCYANLISHVYNCAVNYCVETLLEAGDGKGLFGSKLFQYSNRVLFKNPETHIQPE